MTSKRVAIIDKSPNKNRYSEYFKFEFTNLHMSDVPITKLLKKDVTLAVDTDDYDLIILVGSEAAKEYAKISSVTSMAGHLVNDKFVCMSNPAILHFRPEGKPDFDRAVNKINKIYEGTGSYVATGDFKGINSTVEAKEYLLEVLNSNVEVVAFDTETTCLYVRDGYVLGLSVSYKTTQGRYIVTDCFDEEIVDIINKIIYRYPIVFHNMKFDYKMILFHLGIDFDRERVQDTMLMHYVLDENGVHGLKDLTLKYSNFGDYDSELETFKEQYCKANNILKSDFTYDLIPYDIISKYAAIDTAATLELYYKFLPIIRANDKLNWVYENLMIKGSLFLMDMEEVGIPFSMDRLKRADNYLNAELSKAKDSLYTFEEIREFEEAENVIFNPNSVFHLRKVLFDYAQLTPTGKLTDTGAISTDAEVLEDLSKKYKHPLPAAILNIKKLTKLQNTYITKILLNIKRDGNIYTNFNNTFTTSGRLSSSGVFNAQQIVRDDPIVKGCIVAPDGYVIVSQDLQTGEVYYAAVLSGDLELQSVFLAGGDLHSAIAKTVFNLPCEVDQVKTLYPEMRQAAKAITFGILYGSGAASVAESVSKATGKHYPISQAQDDIDSYFARFNKLKKWLDKQKDFITENGFVYSHFGRKRRLPNVKSSDKGIAAHEVRSGINALIQSVCSDVNLLAAIDTMDTCKKRNIDARIFMLVHDSIVALVKKECVEEYKSILATCTQADRGVTIPGKPIGIDQEVGADYSFGKFEKTYEYTEDSLARI